eukprot:gnl/MRDRNA2_/MRDRNA2_98029_c0_seq1.p1 gnl/MRDRNA2_/MRDRNA2_98029_c0~~gnl/MRDRNA2_/MRDRNA2_98029_c0_seq1.p1  ORF type:complete len:327 (+),score=55.43 gnl/MRDRNA2_/MRDRNA2_98029_c0_seq1:88-1068(+)
MVRSAILLFFAQLCSAHYGKPPCGANERELYLGGGGYDKGAVCAPLCNQTSDCPTDYPKKSWGGAPDFECSAKWGDAQSPVCVMTCDDTGPACPDAMVCSVHDLPGPGPGVGPCIYENHTKVEVSGALSPSDDEIELATFDGKATPTWRTESDPVMGGQSDSTWRVEDGYGEYSGACRIVPKLKAPGFTIVLTENPLTAHFPDLSSASGIVLSVRNVGGNITAFKFAFCDSRINYYRCQFASFKADFSVAKSDTFSEVFLPWSKFSDKWSPYTGEHTAEDPPKAENLKSITQLQIWTEGVAGTFQLQIKYVRAKKATMTSDFTMIV